MKRKSVLQLILISTLAIGLLWSNGVFAEAIQQYHVDLQVDEDAKVYVTERIEYVFDEGPKHGIYREIPYKYKRDGRFNYNLRISDINVLDELGNAEKFRVKKSNGNVNIRIGESDEYVEGVQTYVISYTVDKAIRFFDDYDELYFNPIPSRWRTVKSSVGVDVFAPKAESILEYECFFGQDYDSTSCNSFVVLSDNSESLSFTTPQLSSFEGATIAVSFKKGVIKKPSLLEGVYMFMLDIGHYLFQLQFSL